MSSKEQTERNQLADILERERKKLGLDKSPSPEQHIYKKAECVAQDIANMGRFLMAEIKSSKQAYDRAHMKQHIQKEFNRRFESGFTKEELAFLLSVVFSDELLPSVES